ncbi:MAG: DNA helicase RecQ [Phycisphaerales bacterium]
MPARTAGESKASVSEPAEARGDAAIRPGPAGDPAADTEAIDSEVADVLQRVWGYESLRPLQRQAIDTVIAGRDSLVVMPTGGGKSLCYQVPPLVTGRLHVVVSPLISLMKDQVDGLQALGYPAAALHSGLDAAERSDVLAGLDEGRWRLLYISPERLALDGFRARLVKAEVDAVAIDEAHCISHWGHDFRPDYRNLEALREIFPTASIHAYTATATPPVRDDVVRQLSLRDPEVLIGNFDRPNLTYRMLYRDELADQVAAAIGRHDGEAVIVYCISRRDTEKLVDSLGSRGIDAAAYHAGLSTKVRARVQDEFASERRNIVVATVAFGMGIDRSNVRCVIHAAMPKSIDHFQQETGRAGRDGLASECVLLHGWADVERWRHLAYRSCEETGAGAEALAVHEMHLREMVQLCGTPACRRRTIIEHFGQPWPDEPCGACDVCLGELPSVPGATGLAQRILSCVWRLDQRFGVGQVVDVLRGRRTPAVERWGHDSVSTFGILRELPARRLQHFVHQLIYLGWLERTGGDRPVVRLGEDAGSVLKGEVDVHLTEPPRARGSSSRRSAPETGEWSGVDRDLFERLRELRRLLAAEAGVPAYQVFNDRTLREMAAAKPGSMAEMRGVHGIGERKLERWGTYFLAAVRGEEVTLPSADADADADDGEGSGGGDAGVLADATDGQPDGQPNDQPDDQPDGQPNDKPNDKPDQ